MVAWQKSGDFFLCNAGLDWDSPLRTTACWRISTPRRAAGFSQPELDALLDP